MQVSFSFINPIFINLYRHPTFKAKEHHYATSNRPLRLQSYEECAAYTNDLIKSDNIDKKQIKKLWYMLNDATGHFSVDKSAKIIKSIIDKQLMLYTEDDIKQVVSKILEKHPNVSREIILKELAQLSSFSNYDSLYVIDNYIEQKGIEKIQKTGKLTINNIFNYLASPKKEIIKLPQTIENDEFYNKQSVLFVDRNTIQFLKELKEHNKCCFDEYQKNILTGKIKLAILDGWEAKTNNGLYSFNIVGGWGDLTEAVSDIIQTKKENGGKSLYTYDIIKDLHEIFDETAPEIKIDVIKNEAKELSEKEIANRLNSKTLSEKDIKYTISALASYVAAPISIKLSKDELTAKTLAECDYETLINCAGLKKANIEQREKMQKIFSIIFALTSTVYSPRRLASEMKMLDKKLADRAFYYNKSKENLVFIVPKKEKSYGLINYQYSKVNNTPLSHYVYANKEDLTIDIPDKKNKVFVLLDDFSGSGHSMLWELFPYGRFKKLNPNEPLIFSSIVYTPKAYNVITSEIEKYSGWKVLLKDSFVGINEIKNIKNYINILSHRYRNPLENFVETGYLDGGLGLAFPHVIPDNCTDISGLLLENLLKNPKANKAKMASLRKEILKRTIDIMRQSHAD